jgi:hypothetical protein
MSKTDRLLWYKYTRTECRIPRHSEREPVAKIPLTIDPQYYADWKWYEGVREIIQNAKDGDEYEGAPMKIEHFPRTNRLVISSHGVTLEARILLLLGATSKRDSEQRGQFGEGFAIGCLALVRAGHPVTIYNGDEVWRPAIKKPDAGHPFEGEDLLVFTTRRLREHRDAFSVEIENVSKEVWDITRKLFLFLTPPLEGGVVSVDGGRVLTDEEYHGKIFVRGIFVSTIDKVACGYDLDSVKLDHDRNVIEEWNLRWKLAELLNKAHKQDPEAFAEKIYDMAKTDKSDVKSLAYHADADLLKSLRDEFVKEHGAKAVPVRTTSESRVLEELGATPVVANETLRELLEKTGLTAASVTEELKTGVKTNYTWSDLTPIEQTICTDLVERITKDYSIVDFNDGDVMCQALPAVVEGGTGSLGISRHVLAFEARKLTEELTIKEATRRGVFEREIYLDLLFEE